MTGTLTYVYAVLHDVDDDPCTDPETAAPDAGTLHGIAGSPVRSVAAAGLRAVVGDVDRVEFERAVVERRDDLTWLTTVAREHHRVVDAVGRRRVVAPLALGTVYWDDERVRAVLDADRDRFLGVLDRLAGHAEFGVKAYAVPGNQAAGPAAERHRSGVEYLQARRRALRDDREATDQVGRAAEGVHDAVGGLAVDTRTRPLQDAALSGVTEPMVLNRTYLVPTERYDEFAAAVARAGTDPRLRVELTGPWVPYSFAQDDQ